MSTKNVLAEAQKHLSYNVQLFFIKSQKQTKVFTIHILRRERYSSL